MMFQHISWKEQKKHFPSLENGLIFNKRGSTNFMISKSEKKPHITKETASILQLNNQKIHKINAFLWRKQKYDL